MEVSIKLTGIDLLKNPLTHNIQYQKPKPCVAVSPMFGWASQMPIRYPPPTQNNENGESGRSSEMADNGQSVTIETQRGRVQPFYPS